MDQHEITQGALAILPPCEARVLRLRFGIGMGADHTIEETAQAIGADSEQVEQLENEALRKLKHPLNCERL